MSEKKQKAEKMLGKGMARKAAKTIKSRQQRLREAEARSMGVPVEKLKNKN